MTDQLEQDVSALKTDVAGLKSDVSSLKESERHAQQERGKIHGKLEAIHASINQRVGAEKVRRGLRQWGLDLIKVLAGIVAGWFMRGGSSGG